MYYHKTIPLPAFITSSLSASIFQSVTTEYENLMFYFNHVRKSITELCQIEFQTMSQAACPLWYDERKKRLNHRRKQSVSKSV